MAKSQTLRTFLLALCILACLSSNACGVSGEHLQMDGDVTIAGIFSVQSPPIKGQSTCGAIDISSVMAAEAVKWYLKNLNSAGDSQIKIGLEGHMSCGVDTMAAEIANDVLHQALHARQNASRVIGLIGPESNSETDKVSKIFSSVAAQHHILQLGYTATASDLNNRVEYPNFFRVIPSDDKTIKALILSMQELEWNRIAVIYEYNSYTLKLSTELVTQAEQSNICVSLVQNVSEYLNLIELKTTLDKVILKHIGGIVYFGSEEKLSIILKTITEMKLQNAPVFIVIDSLKRRHRAFDNLDITKGAFVVSSPNFGMETFRTYWAHLFKNKTKLEIEALTNPWLLEVYEYIQTKYCVTGNCEEVVVSDSDIETEFKVVPASVQYALIATHALVKTFFSLYNNICSEKGSVKTLCDTFLGTFTSGQMVDRIKTTQMDMKNDFNYSILNPEVSFNFSDKVDAVYDSWIPSNEVRNYRKGNQNGFTLIKVGELIGETFMFNKTAMHDYSDDGQCSKGSICSECLPVITEDNTVIVNGQLFIVALVPVHDRSLPMACGKIRTVNGYQLVEVIKFALRQFNTNETSSIMDKTVGLILIDTCNNPRLTQHRILDLYKHGANLGDGRRMDVSRKILGVVGALGSEISIAAADMLTSLDFVQVSYGSTSPLLSDRENYPFFMRNVNSFKKQAKVIINIVKKLDGKYIQIIYSHGSYGEGGKTAVEEVARDADICIANSIMVVEDVDSHYYGFIDRLREYPYASVVVVVLRSHIFPLFIPVASKEMKLGEFQLIASDTFGKNTHYLENPITDIRTLIGTLFLVSESPINQQLESYLRGIRPSKDDALLNMYLETKLDCNIPGSYDRHRERECTEYIFEKSTKSHVNIDSWVTQAYTATDVLLTGSSALFKNICGATRNQICLDYIDKPELIVDAIVSESKRKYGFNLFDDNKDGDNPYQIYNIQRDPDDPQKAIYKQISNVTDKTVDVFDLGKLHYPGSKRLVSVCPSDIACSHCHIKTPANPLEDEADSVNTAVVVLGVIVALLVLAVVATFGFFKRRMNRNKNDALNKNTDNMYITPEGLENPYVTPLDCDRPAPHGYFNGTGSAIDQLDDSKI